MKKSFVLLVTLVLLILGTVYYAQDVLLKEADQVHFTEQIIFGDKSVVDGVVVEMYNEYDYQLFWDSTYVVGEKPKESTEYTFYSSKFYSGGYATEGEFDLLSNYGSISMFQFNEYLNEEKEYSGLEAAMKELYDATAPGTENEMMISLKDYVDYYPYGMNLELPTEDGINYRDYYFGPPYMYEQELIEDIAQMEAPGKSTENLNQLKKCLKDLQNFQEFFKIPVLENEMYAIAIAKDAEGRVVGIAEEGMQGGSSSGNINYNFSSQPSVGRDSFTFNVNEAFTDGNCFFTFSTHTVEGNIVDTSLIPGGYGIYHFTYDSEKGEIDSENIKMIYALNPVLDYISLEVDGSGQNLLLTSSELGHIYLSVIDIETMTLVDKFDIGSEWRAHSLWSFEDYMVIESDMLTVYTMDGSGRYTKAFSVDSKELEERLGSSDILHYMINYSSSFDWDGEKLLVGNYMYMDREGHVGRASGFTLVAIDETGLLYYGTYPSTLITNERLYGGYAPCTPSNEKEISVIVQWGE